MPAKLLMQHQWLGKRVKRVEDGRFLRGRGRYVDDISLPGTLHIAFVRSPHAHALIREINADAARKLPGVVAVVTGNDLDTQPLQDHIPLAGLQKTPLPALAGERVRFAGEAVAAVVAESRYVAEDAAELVKVDYEPLPVIATLEQSMSADAPLLFPELKSNVVYRKHLAIGDVAAAFARADLVVEKTHHSHRVSAMPMEGRGCVAYLDPASERMTVWTSTQSPHPVRTSLAEALGFPEQDLRVVAPEVGGGFGQKQPLYPEEVVVACLAWQLNRPVKWTEDRREHFLAAAHGKEQLITLEAAVKQDGTLLALRARCIGDTGAYSMNPVGALIEPYKSAHLMPSVYRIENYEFELLAALTNKTPIGPYRGVGWTAGHSARELLFDEVARRLRMDPVEFRRKNMIRSDEFPYRQITGQLFDSGSYQESLDAAVETIDYERLRGEQAELRRKGRYIGIGISPFVEPTGWGSEVAAQNHFPLTSHDNATVTMAPSGKVTVAVSVSAHGQGHETSFAQLAADILGLKLEDVRVVHGDTDVSPFGMGSYASRSAVVGGGTVGLAAQEVREKLLNVAAALLETSPADLVIADSRISVRGAPQRSVSVAEVAGAAYFAPQVRNAGVDPYLEATRFYDPRATYSNGCHAAVVEVDIETGVVKMLKMASVEDCGTMLNPMIVEAQVHGGVAQGIGMALHEHLVYDDNGQLNTTSYMDYLVPTTMEIPHIHVTHLVTPSPFTVGGIKGMGESALIAVPAAVANAVIDAVSPLVSGIDNMPFSPDRVWSLLNAANKHG